MDVARLVLDFVKSLIWPVAIVLLLLTFRAQIKQMLLDISSRITGVKLPGGAEVQLSALMTKTDATASKTEEIVANRLDALGWIYTEFSMTCYRRYEALWRHENYAGGVGIDLEFRENMETAIGNAQRALKTSNPNALPC